MDSFSRFRNGAPLKNGTFNNNPPPIQSEGVGMKPLPSLLVDRFRAMVKDREEELRVFGRIGEEGSLNTNEIVRIYEIVLSELTLNAKATITDLTILAGEQRAHAKGIADAICSRIIEVPVDHKLPSLYLLDSIVKNIGKEYIKYFSAHLREVFCEAYSQVHPSMHPAMRHLFGTWSTVFPLPVLRKIEAQLQFSPSVNAQSSFSSLRASESPQSARGIHVNPKYVEPRHQFGHSTVDSGGSDVVGSTVEFSVDISPRRASVRASPSRFGNDPGPTRNWHEKFDHRHKTSAPYNNNDVDLRGPRALISAYGVDEREKKLNHVIHNKPERFEEKVFAPKVSIRTWQNSEEEEFDWEDMTKPSLESRRQTNETYSTERHSTERQNFGTRNATPLPGHGAINTITRLPPNVAGPIDMPSQIPPPNFPRESPHQQSQNHLNAKGGDFFSESRTFLTGNDQKPPVTNNFPSSNGNFGASLKVVFPFNNSSPLPEIRPGDTSALVQGQNPSPSVQILPPLPAFPQQMPLRGQVVMNQTTMHPEQQVVNLPQFHPIQRPIRAPLNMQNPPQFSQVQPNLPRVPLPNYGYLAQGQGLLTGFAPSNMVQHPPLPNFSAPNMSFHVQRGPRPMPISQNVAPTPQTGGPLSGLFSSLMAQGLISATKQDPIGVEFDPETLKTRHEPSITALYFDLPRQCKTCGLRFKTQEEHSQHMDWHVSKNRTLKTRKTKPSPKWFVSLAMWLHGSESSGNDPVPRFLPEEKSADVDDDDDDVAVPADEDQNCCALCGERFEDFYSDETEEWMYKGAVYMYAPPGGATVGMERSVLGPIVHAKCKSDSDRAPDEESRKNEEESTEEGGQRKRPRN